MTRILVLEDDANMRSMLELVLEKEGYQVEAVGTGLEAVRRASQSAFDLVIVDIRMEGIDGLEALAKVRELNELMGGLTQPCPVIGVAMNSRRISPEQAEEERRRVQDELNLPVCDVIRHGPDELIEAILRFESEADWRRPVE